MTKKIIFMFLLHKAICSLLKKKVLYCWVDCSDVVFRREIHFHSGDGAFKSPNGVPCLNQKKKTQPRLI